MYIQTASAGMVPIRSIPTILLSLAFSVALSAAQERPIVGGTVLDAETMKPIPDVYVIVNNDGVAAATDLGGYFEIRLTEDVYLLEFRHVAYLSKFYPLRVVKRQGQMLLIELNPRVIQLPEVMVTEKLDRLTLLDERNTYAVIHSDEIQTSKVANVRDLLRRLAPSAATLYSTPSQRPPILYLNGVLTESWVADLIDVQTIDKVLVWRTVDAPSTSRSGTSRYLIEIRTKDK
ncbi:MAG: carboxypeptidase-like regulatory domain-containing protein [Bacteroidota bacterium]